MAAGVNWRSGIRLFTLAVSGLLIALAFLSFAGSPAQAQELIRRQGLFDRLFGGPPPREALPPPPQQRRLQQAPPRAPAARRARRSTPRAAAPAPQPVAPAIDKLDNALTVLVVGDFLASGLAEGLEAAYAESPGVVVVDKTNGSSGFVRDDFYDWNAQIGPILEEVKPAVVVMMIGSNDRQPLALGGRSERPQTEPWLKEYVGRITSFSETIETEEIPIVWAGLPPFKSPSMSSDMLAFNDIYKQAVEKVDGTFVDIWDGFSDENGAFTSNGPDVNGQPVRLRGSDGINLTRAGKRKVAFYVEQTLNKLLGSAASPEIDQQELESLPPPGIALAHPEDLRRTRPISLATPELGGSELMGAAPPPTTDDRPAQAARPGRADNFSLRGDAESGDDGETTTAITP